MKQMKLNVFRLSSNESNEANYHLFSPIHPMTINKFVSFDDLFFRQSADHRHEQHRSTRKRYHHDSR